MTLPVDQYYESQLGVIGSLLLDAPKVAGMVMHRTQADDFTGVMKTIYQAARTLFLEGRPIDPVTIQNAVGKEYGETLMQIMDLTPTAANVEAYIDLTLEQAKLSKLRGLFAELSKVADLEEAQRLLAQGNRVVGGRASVQIVNMEQGIVDFYERQKKPANLMKWGMAKVDKNLKLEYGDFLVLGGYPSAGKTALSLQMAWSQALHCRVGYFSLETKPEKLIDRTVAAVCGVDMSRIKEHVLRPDDWMDVAKGAAAFRGRNMDLIKAGGLSVVDIQALALAGQYDIIYIDYLQLVAPEDRRRSDVEQVTQISKDLHTMAQTTGITVCALSQLTRPEKSGAQEKAPGLHSLRQSGQIEQDADGVMLLYKEHSEARYSRRVLKIAKNKDGEAGGLLYLDFVGSCQQFKPSPAQISLPPPDAEPKPDKPGVPQLDQVQFSDLREDDPELPF